MGKIFGIQALCAFIFAAAAGIAYAFFEDVKAAFAAASVLMLVLALRSRDPAQSIVAGWIGGGLSLLFAALCFSDGVLTVFMGAVMIFIYLAFGYVFVHTGAQNVKAIGWHTSLPKLRVAMLPFGIGLIASWYFMLADEREAKQLSK